MKTEKKIVIKKAVGKGNIRYACTCHCGFFSGGGNGR